MSALDPLRQFLESSISQVRSELERLERALELLDEADTGDQALSKSDASSPNGLAISLNGGVSAETNGSTAPTQDDSTRQAKGPALKPKFRDKIVKLSKRPDGVTAVELAEEMSCARSHARKQLLAALDRGVIRDGGKRRSTVGKRPTQFVYVVASAQKAEAANRKQRKANSKAAPVPHVGKEVASGDPEVKKIVRKAKAAGAEVEKLSSGHVRITGPKGSTVISGTPKKGRSRTLSNGKAQLKRAGVE